MKTWPWGRIGCGAGAAVSLFCVGGGMDEAVWPIAFFLIAGVALQALSIWREKA